jgi:hypothetical protein
MAQQFSNRSMALSVAGMILAIIIIVISTLYVLHAFLLDNAAEPLKKAGRRAPLHMIR